MKSNINSIYRYHNSFKIYQGDIFRDVKVITDFKKDMDHLSDFDIDYMIVISQECDLDNDFDAYLKYVEIKDDLNYNRISKKDKDNISRVYDKLLPSILFCPAFPAEKLREGKHLENYNNFLMPHINTKKWNNIKNNETPRYYFLKSDLDFQIPELVIDFKRYYTLPVNYVYSIFNDSYLGSLNELYRENLSQRFVNYLSRIGLPLIIFILSLILIVEIY